MKPEPPKQPQPSASPITDALEFAVDTHDAVVVSGVARALEDSLAAALDQLTAAQHECQTAKTELASVRAGLAQLRRDKELLEWVMAKLIEGGSRGLNAAITHRDDMERAVIDRDSIAAAQLASAPKQAGGGT